MPDRPLPTTYHELLDVLPHQSATARNRRVTMRLMAARDALAAAEEDLRTAVRESYDGGDSWLTIGTILGISGQAHSRGSGDRSDGGVRSERFELSLDGT